MESVTVSRTVEAPPEAVREVLADVESFLIAAGFDDVEVEGSRLTIRNAVGLATIELVCEIVDSDAALAYEQREGIFESMTTRYELEGVDGATTVRATTDFAVDVALVGEVLDATVIGRQRRRELESQFDHLERVLQ